MSHNKGFYLKCRGTIAGARLLHVGFRNIGRFVSRQRLRIGGLHELRASMKPIEGLGFSTIYMEDLAFHIGLYTTFCTPNLVGRRRISPKQ